MSEFTDNQRQPNPPELSAEKERAVEELESQMSWLGGLVEEIKNRDGEQMAIDLMQEAICEQLPKTSTEMYDLILRMGWKDKAYSYLEYKKEQYIEGELR